MKRSLTLLFCFVTLVTFGQKSITQQLAELKSLSVTVGNNTTAISQRITQTQSASLVHDSLVANTVTFSGDFTKSGSTIGLTQPFTGTLVDQSIIAGSANPVSNAAVAVGLAQKALVGHTHTASNIVDFATAVLTSLTALPGYGPGTVLGSGGVWVSATSGTPLAQLATPVLSVGTSTSTTIPLTWGAVANATSYTLSQAIDPQFSNGLFDAYTGSGTSFTPSGLASGTTFYYRLTAGGSGYANSNYGFATATTTGASVPTLATPVVTVGSATTATLTASWPAVTNATSYSVAYATNAGFTTGLVSSTQTGTSLLASGLLSATTYYFRVAAAASGYASSSYGTASGTTSTTGTATTALTAPTLALSGATSSGVTTSWSAIPNASSYSLDRATDAGFTANLVSVNTGNVTTYAVSGLSASTTYYFRLKAVGSGSFTDSPYATTQSVTTSASGGTPLATLSTLYLNGATTTTLAASWTSVANVTSYQLEAATTSNFASVVATGVSSGTLAYAQITGLSPGTTYYLRAKAVGSGSFTDGAYSPTLTTATTASVGGTYAETRRFKVNFSTSSNATAVATWNVLAPANGSITTGYVSTNLVDATGTASTLSLSIVSGFSGGGVANFGGASQPAVAYWPTLVMNRSWSYPAGGGVIQVSGLDPTKYYSVYALIANNSATAYYGSFSASGVVGGVKSVIYNGTDSSPGELAGAGLYVVNNVQATAGGGLTLAWSKVNGSNSSQPTQGFILVESNIPK